MSKLTADRIKPAEFVRNVFRVNAPEGVAYKDVLVPDFWAHVSATFSRGDSLEVFAEDSSWYAQLLVLDASRLHAKVTPLIYQNFQIKAKKEVDPDFSVEFKGPQRKWSVLRKKDKEIVKDGFESKDDAATWLEANKENFQ